MRSLAADEYSSLATTFSEHITAVFPSLLTPVSPTANLSALMELKSGVGGSEASLFLTNLLRMYQRYAHTMRWKANVVASNENEGGGTKDAVIEFEGKGAYDALRWESGVHRVQRVPATEASGRVHTSTVAIVVGIFEFALQLSVRPLLSGIAAGRGEAERRVVLNGRCEGRSDACEGGWGSGKLI